ANTVLLRPFDKEKLQNIAKTITSLSGGDKQVQVIGYTDSIGPEAYNLKLSERRAQTVADYLASQGVRNITVKGMGEADFVGDNDTSEGRALNRRVEVIAQ
ncbi:MAG: OmpA family protein, partial [Pseudomonadota bacterium]